MINYTYYFLHLFSLKTPILGRFHQRKVTVPCAFSMRKGVTRIKKKCPILLHSCPQNIFYRPTYLLIIINRINNPLRHSNACDPRSKRDVGAPARPFQHNLVLVALYFRSVLIVFRYIRLGLPY